MCLTRDLKHDGVVALRTLHGRELHNTRVGVSNTHPDVPNTHVGVSNTREGVSNTHWVCLTLTRTWNMTVLSPCEIFMDASCIRSSTPAIDPLLLEC